MRWLGSLVLLLTLLVPLVAHTVEPGEELADPKLEARARAISGELRCVVCQNESIDTSEAELARDLRRLVRERNRRADSLELTVLFAPTLSVGLTVTVEAPSVQADGVRVVIEQIKHTIQGPSALTTITTNQGELS